MGIELLTPYTKVELQEEIDQKHRAVGLFWGNFNPVHIGHLTVADQVRQQLHLEEVIFLPEHNTNGHVKKMLELALDGQNGLRLDDCRAENHCDIFETVKKLKDEQPETDFYFILGGDMIAGLPHWKHIDELLEIVQLVGVRRPRYRAGTSYPMLWIDVPLLDISGNLIREQLKKGIQPNFLLAPKVLEYIQKEGLYV